jgi:hypothetical protein
MRVEKIKRGVSTGIPSLTTLRYSDIDVLTNIEGTIENLIEYLSSQASKSPFNPPFLKGEAETKVKAF